MALSLWEKLRTMPLPQAEEALQQLAREVPAATPAADLVALLRKRVEP